MILDPKTSRKIFELARGQQEELEDGDEDEDEDETQESAKFTLPRTQNIDEDDDDLEEYGDEEYEEVEEIVRTLPFMLVSLDR